MSVEANITGHLVAQENGVKPEPLVPLGGQEHTRTARPSMAPPQPGPQRSAQGEEPQGMLRGEEFRGIGRGYTVESQSRVRGENNKRFPPQSTLGPGRQGRLAWR